MLTLRGLYEEGKIQLLDAPPQGARSLVAVVFLDGMQDQIADAQETMLLAKSPIFKRLVKRGLAEVQQGQTRPVQELLDELPG